MSIEIAAKILGILAHTQGKTSPDIYLCLGELIVKEGVKDLTKEYLYPLKDQGVLFWDHSVWALTVEGYARLNLLRQEVTREAPTSPISQEHFVSTDSYSGEDLRPVAGRAGAFDYRDKASRIGDQFVPYKVATSLNSTVRKVFHD